MTREEAVAGVRAAPLDAAAHATLGDVLAQAGEAVAAHACYRSSRALGGDDAALADRLAAGARIGLDGLDHNRHYRLHSLRDALRRVAGGDAFSLLDIGGGDGALALLLPDVAYRLAEPGVNGLGAEDLPDAPDSVDVVCACHVYEHISADARPAFLDGLVRTARRHVVLLNPFAAAGVDHEERLRIAVDLLDADWAREHLACGLPDLGEVTAWAESRGLRCRAWPNGAVGTAFLATWVGHYARLAGRGPEADRIHRYLNGLPRDLLTAPELPAAWFVHLDLSG